ncbi:ATP-binding protein [Streptomyces zhihengii]|uniref:ATP-binding protein n=1 Tax=Streptomyces zhihengii TaxID=1818004 RepID=UPI0033B27FD1
MVQARDVAGGIHFHHADRPAGPSPRQLPADVRGFVGRREALDILDGLVEGGTGSQTVVISTIAGTAGVGKTSLATHWAHRVKDRFPDGQLHVNLRGYDAGPPVSADQALERFLRSLGVAPGAIPDDPEDKASLYRSLLAGRRMLIVLDNAAAVRQVRLLLPGSSSCVVLVTSRDRLSGLVARDGAHRLDLDVLAEDEAVQLLRDSTRGHRGPDSEADLVQLARLCARLPLALRIAAERAAARAHMPLGELIRDLQDESSLWTVLSTDEEDDADAVHTVFAWSYRALGDENARMFRLLGLHPGPDFSVHAAAALAGVSVIGARRLLDGLAGTHLISATAYDRFQFHDLLRAFALEQAVRDEEPEGREAAVKRLCKWYLEAMAAAAEVHDAQYADDWHVHAAPTDLTGVPDVSDYERAMAWFTVETDNLVAISRLAAEAGLHEVAWKLPALLRTPFLDRHPVQGWFPMADDALTAAHRSHDVLGQAVTLLGMSIAHRQAHQVTAAVEHSRSALAAARQVDDAWQTIAALVMLGHALRLGRRLDEALRAYEEALEIARRLRLRLWIVWGLIGRAEALLDAGSHDEARECVSATLRELHEGESLGARSECLWVEATIARETGRLTEADHHIGHALHMAYETRNVIYQGQCETELGRIRIATDRADDGLAALQRAASIGRLLGDQVMESTALDVTGLAYQALDRLQEALPFHRLALTGFEEIGDNWRVACALENLAAALDRSGDPSTAASHRLEAVRLLRAYTDQRARSLCSAIESRLSAR